MKGNGNYYACGETCPQAHYYTCTLERGHYGPHVAKGVGPNPLATWFDDEYAPVQMLHATLTMKGQP